MSVPLPVKSSDTVNGGIRQFHASSMINSTPRLWSIPLSNVERKSCRNRGLHVAHCGSALIATLHAAQSGIWTRIRDKNQNSLATFARSRNRFARLQATFSRLDFTFRFHVPRCAVWTRIRDKGKQKSSLRRAVFWLKLDTRRSDAISNLCWWFVCHLAWSKYLQYLFLCLTTHGNV